MSLLLFRLLDLISHVRRISVTFVRPNGEKIKATAKEGDTLLDVVVNNHIEIDGFGKRTRPEDRGQNSTDCADRVAIDLYRSR